MAAEHVLDQGLTVDRQVDRPAHRLVGRNVVARLVSHVAFDRARCARWHRRQRNAPTVDRRIARENIAGNLLPRIGRVDVGNVDLAGAGGGKRGVFVHKDHYNAVHLGLLAVIARVRLKDRLLALVPLRKNIAP